MRRLIGTSVVIGESGLGDLNACKEEADAGIDLRVIRGGGARTLAVRIQAGCGAEKGFIVMADVAADPS